MDPSFDTAEGRRLRSIGPGARWRRWGPYLSDRQWGTVREDYSPDGTAWDYLPHDHARSRAYRWGEDGLAGFCDDQQLWCLSVALWNENDPILKERLFGLTNSQGNHGEDVKEQYFFLDGTPTHSYMKMLYRYPHAAFPYQDLIDGNVCRSVDDREYELADTGVMNGGYFDVVVEYAKDTTDDVLMLITVHNRGPEHALHVLPQLWARNTWSWDDNAPRPHLTAQPDGTVRAARMHWRARVWEVPDGARVVFCENETNTPRLFGTEAPGPFKDGFGDWLIHGEAGAIRDDGGTKCAAHQRLVIPAGGRVQVRTRLRMSIGATDLGGEFDTVMALRRAEADEFYEVVGRHIASDDAKLVQRQAFAGLLWTKQYYHFAIPRWLEGDPAQPPPPPGRKTGRNSDWRHLNNADVLSMPDSWEYPWFAAWDLGFHAIAFASIDLEFAKQQLLVMTREWYMHPNGQLPAYEWAFGDVNPPVHAWAALRVYQRECSMTGTGDRDFLERVFHKLMLNFAWWVNRKDPGGRNVFQGGFLGLDNISLFDRSKPLPTGGSLDQADGTAWMAMYALNLMRIALVLAETNKAYEDIASKFFEHFLLIAESMAQLGNGGLWDEAEGFFYDVIRLPDGTARSLQVRTMVGLIPLFAVEVLEPDQLTQVPDFAARLEWFLQNRPDLANLVSRWREKGAGETTLLSLLRGHRMNALLVRMLDETEFLSDHGVRSLSKAFQAKPYQWIQGDQSFEIGYVPGEGTSRAFGGNSNWRGPVWMPVNVLLIDSLREFHRYYGDDFRVECPVGSGTMLSLAEVADELSARLCRLFLRGPDGRRPAMGDGQEDGMVLFHEYFDGDTGRGVGASHQTGWTAAVVGLLR